MLQSQVLGSAAVGLVTNELRHLLLGFVFTITARRIWFFPLESDGIATLGLFCVSRDAFSFSTWSKAPSEDRFSFLPLSEDRRTFFSLKGLFPSWVSVFKEMFPPPPSEVEELRSLSTYFFFFFWETFLHYSPVRSPLVYYSMVICAVLHHLYSSFNCTGLSIIWTSLHPCIAICIPNFRTFNNIYIYLTSYFHNSSPNVALNFLTGSTMSKAY